MPAKRARSTPPPETTPGRDERSARRFLPASRSLPALRAAAETCQGCDLYLRATRVVFGAGPRDAKVMLVGEQPGDREDMEGKPFIGPAGAILDRALDEAGLTPGDAYVTNAVKHFRWEPRGKRRVHKKPRVSEMKACRPWLEAEIEAVGPAVIVCLGATAAQALLGAAFRLTAHRGEVIESAWAPALIATIHPSSILRAPDADARREAYDGFVTDLKKAAALVRQRSS
jgi:uracil-DNA glycosylase